MKQHYEKKDMFNCKQYPFNVEYATLNYDFPMHTHDFFEVVIIISGSATHLVGQQRYFLKPGDAFVIKGELPHGFCEVQKLELINLMYNDSIFINMDNDLRSIAGFEPLFLIEPEIRYNTNYKDMLSLSNDDLQYIKKLAMLIIDLNDDKAIYCNITTKMIFLAVIANLASKYDAPTNASSHMQLLATVIRIMQENLHKQLRTSEIAKSVYISVRQLERLFEQYYQETPINYLNGLRLRKAYTLIEKSDQTISEIARTCGFTDASYFSRVFKQRYGFAPSRVREIERNK